MLCIPQQPLVGLLQRVKRQPLAIPLSQTHAHGLNIIPAVAASLLRHSLRNLICAQRCLLLLLPLLLWSGKEKVAICLTRSHAACSA
jgi:hypothetical protein